MSISLRIRPAIYAGLIHLIGSAVVALVCAVLIFGVWYPYPYSTLVGGTTLFLMIVMVDIVSGPLLTLVVYNLSKPKRELVRDIGIIVVFQMLVLLYGVYTMHQARPVLLAFEGEVFRVVSLPDIDIDRISLAPPALQEFSFFGPSLVGVKLITGTDSDFPRSITLAMQGLHPAFRPERWVDYEDQSKEIISKAKPLSFLINKHPQKERIIFEAVNNSSVNNYGYFPLIAASHTDWVVVISLKDARPVAYLPLDAW